MLKLPETVVLHGWVWLKTIPNRFQTGLLATPKPRGNIDMPEHGGRKALLGLNFQWS